MFCKYNQSFIDAMLAKKTAILASRSSQKIQANMDALKAPLYRILPLPFLMSQQDFDVLSIQTKHILAAQVKLYNQLKTQYSREQLMQMFTMPKQLARFVDWDLLSTGQRTYARLDVIPHNNRYSVCELNIHTGVGGMTCSSNFKLFLEALKIDHTLPNHKDSPYYTHSQ